MSAKILEEDQEVRSAVTNELLLEPEFEGCCGEIYMTKKRFLVFTCTDCDVRTNNLGVFLVHLTEHWPKFDLKQAISKANEVHELNASTSVCESQEVSNLGIISEIEEIETIDSEELILKNEIEPDVARKEELDEEHLLDETEMSDPANDSLEGSTNVDSDCHSEIEETDLSRPNTYTHLPKPIFPCPDCNMFFYQPHRLREHAKSHSNERNYKCKYCGYAFKQVANLNIHLRRHSGKKRYTCTFCPKMFHTRSEMITHERRHTGEKPFICSHCGKGFVSSGSLVSHSKRHSTQRPYQCDSCDKNFINAHDLKDHMTVHTQERNYTCETCSATFKRAKSLRTHMKLHANKREYVCGLCDAAFNQRPALTLHMKNKHKVMPAEVPPLTSLDNSTLVVDHGVPTCVRCNMGFANMSALLVHDEQMHDGKSMVEKISVDQIDELVEIDEDNMDL